MAIVVALYVLVNVAYMKVMTIAEIAATERGRRGPGHAHHGPNWWSLCFDNRLAFDCRAVNGCVSDRCPSPLRQARDGLFFAGFGEIHPRFLTPSRAIVWGGIWTAILVLTGSYETLYSYSILAAWLFYTLSVAAVFVCAAASECSPAYRMWGYPSTLWLFVVVLYLVYGGRFCNATRALFHGLRDRATGILAYWIWRRWHLPD